MAKNYTLLVRLDKQQKERLKALASASGFKTMSNYTRYHLLNPSVEEKLNRIIKLLEEKKRK